MWRNLASVTAMYRTRMQPFVNSRGPFQAKRMPNVSEVDNHTKALHWLIYSDLTAQSISPRTNALSTPLWFGGIGIVRGNTMAIGAWRASLSGGLQGAADNIFVFK